MNATETKFVSADAASMLKAAGDDDSSSSSSAARAAGGLVIALVDWSQLVEDYLDNIGVSFESFCAEMSGGWMFGYVEALKRAGVRTVLFCVSARVTRPERHRHAATGATVCVLPAPAAYRALRRRVFDPYAATTEEAAGASRGVRRAYLSALRNLATYLSTPLVHLSRELRREGCGALLCQDYEHGRFDLCVVLGRALGLPVFATFQGGDAAASRLERVTRRAALWLCDGLVVAAASEAERLRARYHVGPEKIARVVNPLDLSEWHASGDDERAAVRASVGIPPGARVVAWHGRVDFRRKGLDVLIEAWRRVCVERPDRDLRLFLVGTGNDADELRAAVSAASASGARGLVWVDEYLNDRERLRLYLHAADVYAFPSRHEGFAVAPLEAMACGLPVVAADAPGIPELLEGGERSGGLIVPRGDASALALALGRVLDDERLGRDLGERARARVEQNFTPERVGALLRDFFFGRRT